MVQPKNAWWGLAAGLLGLTLAYTLTLTWQGTAFAGPLRCPASGHCTGDGCPHKV